MELTRLLMTATASALLLAAPSIAQEADDVPAVLPGGHSYSPYPEQNFPNRVYFGDTHVHTSFSTDAGMIGNTLGPEEAYRFARGETVASSTGLPARLERPLDFLVVADHAESIGAAPAIARSDPVVLETEFGRQLADFVKAGNPGAAFDLWNKAGKANNNPMAGNDRLIIPAWQHITRTADEFNEPGRFTAFIGFEWTSFSAGNTLHRVVVLRDNQDKANQVRPISSDDTIDPEKLWEWMEAYENKTGGKILAIPHNGNMSMGLMFDDVTLTSKVPLDRGYGERRMRWEPLYEVTQMKGTSDAHPGLSPNDEFADFEIWDKESFGVEKKARDKLLSQEYAREVLKRGLAYEAKFGANPFKFGLIGSTDTHTSLSTTQENNFFGKVVALEPSADPIRFDEVMSGRSGPKGSQIYARQSSASGLAGVWARENTREALWDAMARKEVYATTGTRIRVRVFSGFDFTAEDLQRSDFAKHGYEAGVPMGGDLKAAPDGKAPSFLVQAVRDPDGANLDRVQIIKGWLDNDGKTQERIYDLAVSGGRIIGPDGGCKEPVGNTVNVPEATYTNAIGTPVMGAYWRDPDFDPALKAFYYVRVLEIPTPRWTTYDAKFFGVKLPTDVPASIQERAYTSPIWYNP